MSEKVDGNTSDGFHTFNELYAHRIRLFIALCRFTGGAWRSLFHSDGTMFKGCFIMGIGKEPGTQITYHLPISEIPNTNFCENLPVAPRWDGHTPDDVLTRLERLSPLFEMKPHNHYFRKTG